MHLKLQVVLLCIGTAGPEFPGVDTKDTPRPPAQSVQTSAGLNGTDTEDKDTLPEPLAQDGGVPPVELSTIQPRPDVTSGSGQDGFLN